MDPPAGRRPDVRSAAYESIFGRPTAGHHQPPQVQAPYNQPAYSQWSPANQAPPADPNGPYPTHIAQQHLAPNYPERRTSYAPSIAASARSAHSAYGPPQIQGPPHAGTQQQHAYHQSQYLQPAQQHVPYRSPSFSSGDGRPQRLSPGPAPHSRGSSVSPPNHSPAQPRFHSVPEGHVQSDMTEAQAYQAQVYEQMNQPPPPSNNFRTSAYVPMQQQPPTSQYSLPVINTDQFHLPALEINEGRLSLDDFTSPNPSEGYNGRAPSTHNQSIYGDNRSLRTMSTDQTRAYLSKIPRLASRLSCPSSRSGTVRTREKRLWKLRVSARIPFTGSIVCGFARFTALGASSQYLPCVPIAICAIYAFNSRHPKHIWPAVIRLGAYDAAPRRSQRTRRVKL